MGIILKISEHTIPRYDLNKINTIPHCDELFPASYEMPIISSVYPLQKTPS